MVRCMICGREFTRIPPAHLKKHGLSGYKEYKRLFPGAETGYEGKNNPFYGRKHTEETKRKISEKCKGRIPWNKGLKGYTYEELYGKEKAKELIELRRKKSIERWKNENDSWNRKGKTSWNKGMKPWEWMDGEKFEEFAAITWIKPGTKPWEKAGMTYEEWYNEVWLKKIFPKWLEWRKKCRPTTIEKRIIDICEKYNLPYKYVGNGDLWISRMNPDFINTDDKIIIECLGEIFHNDDEFIDRAKKFNEYGYRVLGIYESVIRKSTDEELVNIIHEFENNECKYMLVKNSGVIYG